MGGKHKSDPERVPEKVIKMDIIRGDGTLLKNIDLSPKNEYQEVLQNVTCDKALLMYNDYISGSSSAKDGEENIYTMLSLMRQKGQDDKELKKSIISLFCDDKN